MPRTRRPYAPRRLPTGLTQVNFTMDVEAFDILARFAPSQRSRGMLLSRLLHEHVARLEERERIKQALGMD